jgi:hypothetical protein
MFFRRRRHTGLQVQAAKARAKTKYQIICADLSSRACKIIVLASHALCIETPLQKQRKTHAKQNRQNKKQTQQFYIVWNLLGVRWV